MCSGPSASRTSPSRTARASQIVDTVARAGARRSSGALGISGITAYFGLFDVGWPEPGQTVAVSAAAGSVGIVVGQLAKIHGCRVVGIAGGPEKVPDGWSRRYGFDAAVDHQRRERPRRPYKEHAPDGIDVFFDNVGGEVLEAALARLARGARIVLSGAVSQYNSTEEPARPGQLHAAAGSGALR